MLPLVGSTFFILSAYKRRIVWRRFYFTRKTHTIFNMRLFSEIKRALGQEEDSARVQYTVLDGGGGYFQNVKKILEFSETLIVFAGRRGAIRIEGEGLHLGKYYLGDALVRGSIVRVSRCE